MTSNERMSLLRKKYIFRSRSTPPSTPSSQPVVERCTWLINDRGMMRSTLGHAYSDQDSLTSTSQAFLECLDRYGHHGRLNGAYEGIIRICLAEILANSKQPSGLNPTRQLHSMRLRVCLRQTSPSRHCHQHSGTYKAKNMVIFRRNLSESLVPSQKR